MKRSEFIKKGNWEEETIQDGWHRLTDMLSNKVKEIPFVYYL